MPLAEMFRGDQRRRTVMWWIFQVLQTVGYYGFGSLAPVVLTAKGHTVTESLLYAALSFCGYPIGSALSIPLIDRIERRTLIIASALGIAGCGLAFGFATPPGPIVTFGFLLTVCSNVFSNAFHVYQTEIFPTGLRSSAIGIAYSLSRLTSVAAAVRRAERADRPRRGRGVHRLGGADAAAVPGRGAAGAAQYGPQPGEDLSPRFWLCRRGGLSPLLARFAVRSPLRLRRAGPLRGAVGVR